MAFNPPNFNFDNLAASNAAGMRANASWGYQAANPSTANSSLNFNDMASAGSALMQANASPGYQAAQTRTSNTNTDDIASAMSARMRANASPGYQAAGTQPMQSAPNWNGWASPQEYLNGGGYLPGFQGQGPLNRSVDPNAPQGGTARSLGDLRRVGGLGGLGGWTGLGRSGPPGGYGPDGNALAGMGSRSFTLNGQQIPLNDMMLGQMPAAVDYRNFWSQLPGTGVR